jgi:hypothetical protein
MYIAKMLGCNAKIILGQYQDHFQQCPLKPVFCSNKSCCKAVLQKDMKERLSTYCQFQEEKYLYYKKDQKIINQNHEENLCSEYQVPCPNKCSQIITRTG